MTAYCNECGADMKANKYSSVCLKCGNLRAAKEYQGFKEKLARDYNVVGHPKFERCFALAYQHGHSCGYSEVEIYFSDFVELIK